MQDENRGTTHLNSLTTLVNAAGIGRWILDIISGRMDYSETVTQITGHTADELNGSFNRHHSFVYGPDQAAVMSYETLCFSKEVAVQTQEFRIVRKDGEVIWIREYCMADELDTNGIPTVISGIMLDITAWKAESESMWRGYLMQSINMVATRLITASPDVFEEVIWDSLQTVGQAVGVHRTYIWENYEQEGRLFCRQTYEWVEGVEPQQGKDFAVSMDYDEILFWKESVLTGRIINGPIKNLPDAEREILQSQDIVSVLVIPIILAGQPWGFIGFDDCNYERYFSKAEEQVLQSGGILMTSAILRNKMTRHLMKARYELHEQDVLLRAVNDMAAVLMEDRPEEFGDIILKALRILGESVGMDSAYIWKNSLRDGRLCGTQMAEWKKKGISIYGKPTEEEIIYDHVIPLWREVVEKRKAINSYVRDLDEEISGLPLAEDVVFITILPVILQGEFWGFIGFDGCCEEHVVVESQIDILKSGGMLIASAVVRNEMMESLVEARENALASMRAKTEFLSRMSHEIRTPMNAIIGMTTIATKSDDLDRVRACLEKVDSSSRQLLGIINDVLDMSKIEANKLEIIDNEFDFEQMIENVFNVIQVKADEKRQDFKFDFKQVFTRNMVSDELRLSQVLTNLLSNAVKFTPEGGSIILRVREEPIGAGRSTLRVEVEDSGIGISTERIPWLFRSFEQADGGITRQYGGTGLGLAICKKIINLMDGDIWVKSEPGKGSRFIFEIGVGWGGKCAGKLKNAELRKELRILVVDDMPDVLEYFQNILSSFSIHCDTALGGREAIRMLESSLSQGKPYEIILLDWYMPGFGGGETARVIKRIMRDNIIVVMISVTDWSEIEHEVKDIGVRHFLGKPVLPSVLYNTLVQLTERTFMTERTVTTEEEPDWSDKQLLLVEDIEINREIVIAILENTKAAIDCASDGKQAVEMYCASPDKYDLILMDVQMPVMDGFEATRQIRASGLSSCDTIPILAMTANAFKEDERNCLEAGMNSHIVKPIEVDRLYEVLTQYLSGFRRASDKG